MEQRLDILLVDDDQGDLDLFRRAVTATGLHISVQTLTAGEQAIDYLEAKGDYGDRSRHPLPDLIVLDLKMPRVDGFVFLAWRRASSVFSSIPVIILSGLSAPAEVKLANELGANRHFVKPATPNDWERIVREVWDFCEALLPIKGGNSDLAA